MWGKINLKKSTALHYITGSKELWLNIIEEGTSIFLKENSEISAFIF